MSCSAQPSMCMCFGTACRTGFFAIQICCHCLCGSYAMGIIYILVASVTGILRGFDKKRKNAKAGRVGDEEKQHLPGNCGFLSYARLSIKLSRACNWTLVQHIFHYSVNFKIIHPCARLCSNGVGRFCGARDTSLAILWAGDFVYTPTPLFLTAVPELTEHQISHAYPPSEGYASSEEEIFRKVTGKKLMKERQQTM